MNDLVYVGVMKKTDHGDGKISYEKSHLPDSFKKSGKELDGLMLYPANMMPQSATGAEPGDFLLYARLEKKDKRKVR